MHTIFHRMRRKMLVIFSIPDPQSMLLWSIIAGLCGALIAMFFHFGITAVQWILTQHPGSFPNMARSLPPAARIAVPAIGGFFAGYILLIAQRNAGTEVIHTDYIDTVTLGDGRVPVKQSILRSLSSMLSIGSGGSIGRETPMVQLSALGASLLGRFAKFDADKLRLLVACGAAAGVTAAYSAPIAGAVFVCEIVLGSIAIEFFGPVVISAVVSNLIMREFPDYHALYHMPEFPAMSPMQIPLFVILGALCGVVGPFYTNLLHWSKKQFKKMPLPLPLRLAFGGLCVGIIAIWVPDVWGNGYSVINSVLDTNWTWQLLAVILICKFAASALTAGSGALGGTFTPTIFIGAAFGSLYGLTMQSILPWHIASPYAYAMIGMGAALAGATQAPLMAILMIFEMTLNYQIMLPLIMACVVSYFISCRFGKEAMYKVIQHRRDEVKERAKLLSLTVRDMIGPAKTVVNENLTIKELMVVFLENPVKYLYVTNEENKFMGAVALKDITADLMNKRDITALLAKDYCHVPFPILLPEMTLAQAWADFMTFPGERLPVVSAACDGILLGVLNKSVVLDAYRQCTDFKLL
jgi:CIC family chloride channel protein